MQTGVSQFWPNMAIIWMGAEADIPAGWHLCNGEDGTRDLRNLFVVGAGDIYAVGANGGNLTHNHVITDAGHGHDISEGPGLQGGSDFNDYVNQGLADCTSDVKNHIPPYYALCYIQKI